MVWIRQNPIADFLNTIIVKDTWIVINYWSIVHFLVGIFLGRHIKNWKSALGILILYEIFEWILYDKLFRPEVIADIVWDIIFAMVGYIIANWSNVRNSLKL